MTANPFQILDERLQGIESAIKDLVHKKPEPPKPSTERYLTTDEVAELLSVSRVTLWNWEQKNIIKPYRIGNLKRYRLSEIEQLGQ